ncbi:hypothetical protein JOF48_003135 [Arthrobacter stackebrandtii]|uniref:Uncharacterized protein n=1 Tax=Arthrobacter stackebrandtii TaxID=272161 RepID=A0ABS4Z006_9MICC|nr:hypothetical protein [Arthrobacter stackebrandtii]MBP2414336.1 hypothetical protein [Arthrobacter stackebrandtii]PYH01482.1 hypothetical protein CVV67_03075 [Arthrobacter stackebrandtii]
MEEISWERATAYRQGGRGRENVLSAEVLMALDYLPRQHFLGAVLSAAHGADASRQLFVSEVERAEMDFLPGDMALSSEDWGGRPAFTQPDALVTCPSSFLLVEAKRIRSSSFQPKQLAQELLAAMMHAGGRKPLILLLGVTPRVLVRGGGRMTIHEAVSSQLGTVLAESGNTRWGSAELIGMLDEVFCWISWDEVKDVVRRQTDSFTSSDPAATASVRRLAASINHSIAWHS